MPILPNVTAAKHGILPKTIGWRVWIKWNTVTGPRCGSVDVFGPANTITEGDSFQ